MCKTAGSEAEEDLPLGLFTGDVEGYAVQLRAYEITHFTRQRALTAARLASEDDAAAPHEAAAEA
ncbi:hypothetical protein FE62_15500, partial [Staphylococcus aureus]